LFLSRKIINEKSIKNKNIVIKELEIGYFHTAFEVNISGNTA